MKFPRSLGDYFDNVEKKLDPSSFSEFLSSISVQKVKNKRLLQFKWCRSEHLSFEQFLEELVAILDECSILNVLSHNFPTSVRKFMLYSSPLGELQNSVDWSILYDRIGDSQMAKLLVQCRGTVTIANTTIQLFGRPSPAENSFYFINQWSIIFNKNRQTGRVNTVDIHKSRSVLNSILITNADMFNCNYLNVKIALDSFFNKSASSRIAEVFKVPSDYHKTKKLKQKFMKIYKLFDKLEENFKANEWKVLSIIKAHCGDDSTVDVKKVVNCIISIVCVLLPLEFFGTVKNRSLVFHNMIMFLRLSRKSEVPADKFTKNIKLNMVSWLENKPNREVQYHNRVLFDQFLCWFYSKFVTQLVGSIFHVTNKPNDPNSVLYMTHKQWRKIKSDFFKSYVPAHLVCSSTRASVKAKIGLFPKSKGLRMLCFPEKRYHNSMKPIRLILSHICSRIPVRNRVSSLLDVAERLQNFTRKHKAAPKLFFKKFDIKSCYDSLPQGKILEILDTLIDPEELFEVDVRSKTVLVRSESKGSYSQYSKSDILREVGKQMRNSVIDLQSHQNKLQFSRDQGVFQGFNLSATLCDLFFDFVISKECELSDETLLIRFADDFLVVSQHFSAVELTVSSVVSSLLKCNVEVNELKSISNIDNEVPCVVFCGLNINTKDWGIVRQYHSPSVLPFTSATKIMKYGLWQYQMKNQKNLLCFSNSIQKYVCQNVVEQIKCIGWYIAVSVLNNPFNSLSLDQFKKWFYKFQKQTFFALSKVNNSQKAKSLKISMKFTAIGFLQAFGSFPEYGDIHKWLTMLLATNA